MQADNANSEVRRPVLVRFGDGLFQSVEDWRRQQTDIPSRAAAIRQLIERGLNAEAAQ